MHNTYTRVVEVDQTGKITYEFVGGSFRVFPCLAATPCTHGGKMRVYGHSKQNLIEKLTEVNRYTTLTQFQDERT